MPRRRETPLASTSPRPLELDSATMRAMVGSTMDRIVRHIETLGEQPMHATRGGRKLAVSLREPMPEGGTPFESLLDLLFNRVIPRSFNTASPGYFAYIPGGGLFHSAVADLIADATNRYVGVWIAAPGLVQIEQNVIAWFTAMLGLGPKAGGVLMTGGSLANLTAIVTARRERLPANFLSGVLYASEQVHHSVQKAALLAGFPPERVHEIPCDESHCIRLDLLEQAIAADRASGLSPFLVVASAGTTSTGAVDDLRALADIAAKERLWLHVDAAYGGFFALTARGREALRGIERADSVTLDPHKSLFLPYGTGSLLVRDREALRRAHAVSASYLPPMQTEDDDLVDFCEISPELSRDARGLRVWLPLKMHGAAVFRAELDEKLDLARRAADAIRAMPDVEIVAEPVLSLFAFRLHPKGLSEPEIDALNRKLMNYVNDRQRVFLTSASVGGRFLIRVCILSFRTHADRVDACLEDIAAGIAAIAKESAAGAR